MKTILITGCTDSSMWYSCCVGQKVVYLGEEDDIYWSRDKGGYRNIVRKKDATLDDGHYLNQEKKMKKIFVDMDGVLCNFNKRYTEKFGRTPAQVRADRENKMYSTHWHQFVDDNEFTSLEKMDNADKLIAILSSVDHLFDICILSSAGGFDRQREVQAQKLAWLAAHDIYWPAVVVPGRRFKTGFASSDALIIDDTYDVVESFIKAGGHGVWYKDGGENGLGLIRGHVARVNQ